jgi:hypothetical protein
MNHHYKVLNLSENATVREIKQASRRLLQRFHPDKNRDNHDWAEQKTKKILKAYEILLQEKTYPGVIMEKPRRKSPVRNQAPSKPKETYYMEVMIEGHGFLVEVSLIQEISFGKQLNKANNLDNIYEKNNQHFKLVNIFSNTNPTENRVKDSLVLLMTVQDKKIGLLINKGGKPVSLSTKDLSGQIKKHVRKKVFNYSPLLERYVLESTDFF